MTPALAILAAWVLFSGTHLLLATDPIRAGLVRRLGERGFVNAFSAVAAVAFTVLAATGAAFHAEGAAGPGLAAQAPSSKAKAGTRARMGFRRQPGHGQAGSRRWAPIGANPCKTPPANGREAGLAPRGYGAALRTTFSRPAAMLRGMTSKWPERGAPWSSSSFAPLPATRPIA